MIITTKSNNTSKIMINTNDEIKKSFLLILPPPNMYILGDNTQPLNVLIYIVSYCNLYNNRTSDYFNW